MRTQLFGIVFVTMLLAMPSTALAQRTPHRGQSAAGVDVGIFIPRESGLSTGPDIDGFFEHYLTARESLRVNFGWANPGFEGGNDHSMREVRFGGDLLYNWEGGSIHPFLGAGLGAYFLQERSNGNNIGDSHTQFGGSLIGGVEFFTSNTFSVKAEAAYHVVSKVNDAFNPSGLLLSIGAKAYF
jgi:outer membrane protein with beta-barrel domain